MRLYRYQGGSPEERTVDALVRCPTCTAEITAQPDEETGDVDCPKKHKVFFEDLLVTLRDAGMEPQ